MKVLVLCKKVWVLCKGDFPDSVFQSKQAMINSMESRMRLEYDKEWQARKDDLRWNSKEPNGPFTYYHGYKFEVQK